MLNFQSGVLDKTRLLSNLLMIILLAGNVYFSIQYTSNIRLQDAKSLEDSNKITSRLEIAKFLREFIDTVLNTKGTISFDDRVKLENDIRQIHDTDLTKLWDSFVGSKDSKTAQDGAVKLMSALANKMLEGEFIVNS